jgi:glycosidase
MSFFSGYSQVITTNPEFPTPDKSVTIQFHADKGNQALMDYDGDIYAHTGVITNESTQSSDWKYVIAEWDANTSKAKMQQIQTNLYELEITPSIREFYGVPDDEKIEKMAFVFRNSDGSKVGRAEGGGDIYAEVYPAGLNVNISSPDPNLIVTPEDTVNIKANSNGADSLFLYVKDTLRTEVADSVLSYNFIPKSIGDYEIVVKGKDSEETNTDTAYFHVKGAAQNIAMPDDWQKGINHIADDSIGLALYAPYKDFVYAIGDFSNWRPKEKYLMNYDDSKDIYWIGVGDLNSNKQYIFQYLIDGKLRIADPYSQQVSDPNDRYITEDIYPNLPEYPAEKTSEIASVIQTQPETYNWQNTDFTPPEKEDLVIYELLIRDFLKDHDYETLIDTLPYLKKLGVNAIELMPVNEFEGNSSWGYNPDFYFAPDKYYGPEEDLKAFIDSCHGKGIAVIQDMVLNHSFGQSPMVRMYFDPDAGDYGQPTPLNPWYNVTSPNQQFSWGFDFDHESAQTKAFVDSVNSFWLNEYKVDGFRFDFTKGFTNTSGDGMAYDSDRINILKRMASNIWEQNSKAFVILEHLTVNSEEKELSNYGMMLWGNMNYNYNEATMGYHGNGKSDFSGVSYQARGWDDPHLVGYMESHDEERLMFKNQEYGYSGDDYDIKELETALDRVKLAAAFFIPVPGPKMIWQFGELGYDISIEHDCRTCPKPIKWNYFEDEDRKSLYNFFKVLIHLKKKHEVFSTDDFTLSVSDTMKRIILRHTSSDVVIIGNFGVNKKSIDPKFTQTGTWYRTFLNDSIEVEDVNTNITLDPGDYRFYSTKKFNITDIITLEELDKITTIQSFAGEGDVDVFPNPARDIVRFKFDASGHSEILLNIYNINGQKVGSVTKTSLNSGKNKIQWSKRSNGGTQPQLYFYELFVGDKRHTGKFLKY